MLRILKTTSYSNLCNVDLVFFPIIHGKHFFVVCMHLKRKEVHILDNISSLVTNISTRYGHVVDYLVARFVDFLAYQNHPAQGAMRNAARKILRLGCMTKRNFIDWGFRNASYGDVHGWGYDDLCGLRRESKAQKIQLDELRLKYAAKILLAEIDQKKSDF